MDNLVSARLGDLVNVFIGGDAPKEYTKEASDENAVPIYSNGIEKEGLYGYTCSPKVEGDSVTISARGNVGAAFYRDKPFVPIVRLLALTPNRSLINAKYLYYLLKLDSIISTGAAQQQITAPQIKKHRITYYSDISYQNSIVAILSAYDSQIENNQKRIKLLEQMADNLYKEWFVRFRFPGFENAEFEGGVPKGWKLERLEDFGIVLETGSRPKGGIDSSVEAGVPSLGAEAINGLAEFDYNSLKLVPQDYYDKMKRGKSKGNHILVYKDGAYIGKVTIFRNCFPFKEYSINEHVFFLNTKDSDYQNYLYFTLNQKAFFSLMQNLNRNAAQPGLSQQDMNGIKVFKPTKDVVNTFNHYVEPIFNEVFSLAKEIRLLTHQRDLLLPRLMSGKLSI